MLATTMVLLVLTLLLLLYTSCRKPKGYPPGPKWWPILGCALEVARLRQETKYLCKTCSALGKKYGPVVGLKIGTDRIVVLNDLENIRAMLNNEDCDGRPTGPLYEARTWGARRGLIVVDGQLWVEQRRFVLRHLKEFGFGRNSMATIIENEALMLVEHFKKLLQDGYGIVNARKLMTANTTMVKNNGQIYKLQKDPKDKLKDKSQLCDKFGVIEEKTATRKTQTAADLYMKVEDYTDIKKLSQSTGVIVSMNDTFGVTVLNTLWQMMAGKRFDTDDKQLKYLQRILTKLLEEIDMIGAPFSHFPLLRFIAPEMSGYKLFVETHQELWTFLKEELYNHKNTFIPSAPRDLMDVYLTVLDSKDYSKTFSESQLLGICVDLFIAGSETTSKALGFGFLYLLLFPHVQRKAQEELDRVLGDRFPTLADRSKMPYVQAVVLETIRIFMSRTLNVPHRALRDTYINGHKIPKDTMLIVNFDGVLMDESWGDPENFRPERFLDSNDNIVTPEKYFPFSIGKHRCLGEVLAKSNIFVITAALLQAFTFSVVPGEPQPSTQEFVDSVTGGPKPYRALVTLRK
ncbi:probable cytochrome P450 303a1 [Linepithema humile]|uniref:probable cytochrome P450 303a1 n=1 Tax=Linepithema humile TaxID=83485 RepID=UPI00062354A1|nr:PREDICTED: probable cytochrome P450 303a1 [Linepithema humile]